jgi:2-polyprenyl-6-methoxyphenol hydroxylase-like FAD-dependent oxidoreductase
VGISLTIILIDQSIKRRTTMVLNSASSTLEQAASERPIHDIQHTTCCVVGGGPAGMILAYLLARQNVPVTLLEAHKDFDRDFRGDTIHASVMDIMDELGLADRLLQLRHTKLRHILLPSASGLVTPIDFRPLKVKYPYITLMPQSEFLEFMADEARRYPQFKLVMGARVEELIESGGVVRGVRYQSGDGWHEIQAVLTVGADGRFSRLRRLSGLEAISTSPPMDVLWFRIPRLPSEPEGIMGRFGKGRLMAMLNRQETWQIAYIIPKGSFHALRAAGIEALRQSIVELAPEMADRVAYLKDWKQVSLLSVESDRLRQWYRPGLLLIGDAAHTMSPIGGVGINYAIHDAVAAANLLTEPLQSGRLHLSDLHAVQRRRELPTRAIQTIQSLIQKQVIANVLQAQKPVQLPRLLVPLLRFPLIRSIPARVMGIGLRPEHVRLRQASGAALAHTG